MLRVEDLPEAVKEDLANWVIDNARTSAPTVEAAIQRMSPREAVNAYLEWNGISGYTNDIIRAVFGCFAAEDR